MSAADGGLTEALCLAVSKYLMVHGEGWSRRSHFGTCGQSCPCCRSRAGDYLGVCHQCSYTFLLPQTCRQWNAVVEELRNDPRVAELPQESKKRRRQELQ